MKVFHPFRLDTLNHCLWREEERVSLAPKAFDVLRYLVEHADRLVTQDEILERQPPATTATGAVLALDHVLQNEYLFGEREDSADQKLLWLLIKAARDFIATTNFPDMEK